MFFSRIVTNEEFILSLKFNVSQFIIVCIYSFYISQFFIYLCFFKICTVKIVGMAQVGSY